MPVIVKGADPTFAFDSALHITGLDKGDPPRVAQSKAVTHTIQHELLKMQRWTVIDLQQGLDVAKELGIGAGDKIDAAKRLEFARRLGADIVIVATADYPPWWGDASIVAEAIDVATGAVVWTAKCEGDNSRIALKEFEVLTKELVNELAKALHVADKK
jgi:hypothetical protein